MKRKLFIICLLMVVVLTAVLISANTEGLLYKETSVYASDGYPGPVDLTPQPYPGPVEPTLPPHPNPTAYSLPTGVIDVPPPEPTTEAYPAPVEMPKLSPGEPSTKSDKSKMGGAK